MNDVPHPSSILDDRVHQKARLGILALSSEAKAVEFGYILKTLELTSGNLARHLDVLEKAELITIKKGFVGKRPRSWISLTTAGRDALASEIRALRAIVDRVERANSLTSGDD